MMENRVYQVTIANLTSGQLLSPPVLAAHGSDYAAFAVGEQASEGIWTVAEQGNPMMLAEQLRSTPEVASVVVADGPVHRIGGPGNNQLLTSMPDGCNALGPARRDADGQNARDLTDQPISMHAGIMPGVGDLGQEFAWSEAVVKIIVQRVE
jgi:hypothetical protein